MALHFSDLLIHGIGHEKFAVADVVNGYLEAWLCIASHLLEERKTTPTLQKLKRVRCVVNLASGILEVRDGNLPHDIIVEMLMPLSIFTPAAQWAASEVLPRAPRSLHEEGWVYEYENLPALKDHAPRSLHEEGWVYEYEDLPALKDHIEDMRNEMRFMRLMYYNGQLTGITVE